jgi:hypothetical protein
LYAVIAQPQPNAIPQPLERKRNQLVVAQMVSVPNNVRAGFVYTQHHEGAFLLGQRVRIEESTDEFSHRSEVARVARKLDFLLFHQTQKAEHMPLTQLRNRKLGGQPEQP